MISKRFSTSPTPSAASSGSGVYAHITPGKFYNQFDFWAYGDDITTADSSLSSITTKARGGYFYVPEDMAIDRIAFNVSSSASGEFAKIGWYEVDTDGVAQDLVFETGEMDCSSTGNKIEVVSAFLSKGLYLPAVSATSTSISVTGISFKSRYAPKTFIGESGVGMEISYGMGFNHASGSPGSMTSFPANAASSFDAYFRTYGRLVTLIGVRVA